MDKAVLRNFRSPVRTLRKVKRDVWHRWLGAPWWNVQATDCILASWPRSGNTWMRNMILQALHPGLNLTLQRLDEHIPETDHLEFRSRLRRIPRDTPRIIKSHDPFRTEFAIGRSIYILRDGRDALISWYHFRRSCGQTALEREPFIRACVQGRITYGAWHDHVMSWLKSGVGERLLILRYEEMLANPEDVLRKALDHFGIKVTDEAVEAAVQASSVTAVNSQLKEWAKERGNTFSGGLGGGSGRRRQLTSDELSLFESWSQEAMQLAGYA